MSPFSLFFIIHILFEEIMVLIQTMRIFGLQNLQQF